MNGFDMDRGAMQGWQGQAPARDQAENLRAAIGQARLLAAGKGRAGEAEALEPPRLARVYAVTSGKAGAGKTSVTANLAIALSEMGVRTAIIDAGFGLSSIEVLYGAPPQTNPNDAAATERLNVASEGLNVATERLNADAFSDGPCGVKFISGGTGFDDAMRAFGDQPSAFAAGLPAIDQGFGAVLVDAGAGIAETVIGISLAADEVILVTTPEPASITDSYAMAKTLAQRDRSIPIRLVVNRAESQAEAQEVMSKLALVADKFLDLRLKKLGYIQNDPLVAHSVETQRPFIVGFPNSKPSQNVRDIALGLMERRALGDAPQGRGLGDAPQGRGLAGFFASASRLLRAPCK